jgi:hypothetical protein
LGERRLEGAAQELRASPDGAVLTVLLEAQKPPITGVPPPMRLGALWAVPARGGKPQKLGHGVTNMPGGWLHTADSRWVLFAAGWDPAQQVGELYVQDAKNLEAERQRVSAKVNYFVPSDDGSQLAYIEGGVLHAGKLPAGPFPQLAGEVSTAEFSADGRYLYFKRRFSSAGGLYQVEGRAPPAEAAGRPGHRVHGAAQRQARGGERARHAGRSHLPAARVRRRHAQDAEDR